MAGNDDWPDDWEDWLGEALDLERVPFETPPVEPAIPVAFRAYFADVEWDGFYRQVVPFSRKVCWWLMAKRLEALERLGTDDVIATVRPSYVEWRIRV